jgi:hypothetical protein
MGRVDRTEVERLLDSVRRGDLPVEAAASRLAGALPATGTLSVGAGPPFARIDHQRGARCGFPEVVLGEGKRPEDLVTIAREVLRRAETLLVTRLPAEGARRLAAEFPDAVHHARARALTVRRGEPVAGRTGVLVVSAGTADLPVAEEARVTAWAMGEEPAALYDCGVAGLHRLLGEAEALRRARVVVVVAGMDGALPSVVGGLVAVPVIAVPTSVGYGTGVGGVAPLLTMLNSCAPNVCVVNVDNGFGAGYLASLVNRGRAGAGA